MCGTSHIANSSQLLTRQILLYSIGAANRQLPSVEIPFEARDCSFQRVPAMQSHKMSEMGSCLFVGFCNRDGYALFRLNGMCSNVLGPGAHIHIGAHSVVFELFR